MSGLWTGKPAIWTSENGGAIPPGYSTAGNLRTTTCLLEPFDGPGWARAVLRGEVAFPLLCDLGQHAADPRTISPIRP